MMKLFFTVFLLFVISLNSTLSYSAVDLTRLYKKIDCDGVLQETDFSLLSNTTLHHLKRDSKSQISASNVALFQNKLSFQKASEDGIHWFTVDDSGNLMVIEQKTYKLVQTIASPNRREGIETIVELKNGLLVTVQNSTYTLIDWKNGTTKRLSFLDGKTYAYDAIIVPEGDALVYETVDNPDRFSFVSAPYNSIRNGAWNVVYEKIVILKQVDLLTGVVKSTREVKNLGNKTINFIQKRLDRLSNGDIISSIDGIKLLFSYDQGNLFQKDQYFYGLMNACDYSELYHAPNHFNAVVYFDESSKGEGTWLNTFDTRKLGKPQKTRSFVKLSGSYAPRRLFTILRDSPDGKQILGGDKNGDVVVWDAETGKQIVKLNCFTSSHVTSIAGSSDLLFVGGANKTIQVWKGSQKVAHLEIPHTYSSIREIEISPDQSTVRVIADFALGEDNFKPTILENFFGIKYNHIDDRHYYSKVFTWNMADLKAALE